MNLHIEHEVRPEPPSDERAVIEAALEELAEPDPAAYRSAWRRAAVDADDG